MLKSKIQNIFRLSGFDIRRFNKEVSRMAWLVELQINSVIDIGANVGQFAEEIRKVLPNAHIYSFEPISECFEKLKNSFKDDSAFSAFHFALGETESTFTMQKNKYLPSSSLLPMADSHKELFPHTRESVDEQIQIKRLDDVFPKLNLKSEVLIKVDTQGYEDKVIKGGMNTFPKAKAVIIEASFIRLYENQPLFDDIYQKMKSLGFIYKGALHQKINKKTGEVIFEDAIFIK